MENIKTFFSIRFETIGSKSDHPLVQIGHSYFYRFLDKILKYFNVVNLMYFLLVLSKNEQFDSRR